MKRPAAVYFIAVWVFFALTLQIDGVKQLLEPHLSEEQIQRGLLRNVGSVGMLLIIWHVVRLIQLKPFHRWFATVFFYFWTITILWNSFTTLPRMQSPLRPALVFFVFIMLNLVSAWFLGRRSFRQFSAQFVAEREKEKHTRAMQKASQKKIQAGL